MAANIPARPDLTAPLLVGREREQAILRAHFSAALAGHGSLVLVSGEAGIGKTALAESLCREAVEQGALVLVGRCFDVLEAPPYGPWLELFARYRPAEGAPPLPPVFAERGVVGAIADQATLFHQIRDFVVNLSAQRLLVLVFDDLHWTDPASLALLRVVVRELDSLPALVVATYRVEDVAGQHLLDQYLPAIVREATAERLSLQPLDGDAIRTFAARRFHLPESDQRRLIAYLQERGEGNPFFIGELLRTLEEAGALRNGGDSWVLGDLRNVRVPPLVRQVIRGRLARLDAEAQRLLAIAAVIGQEVPLALWATVAEKTENALLTVVEQAVEAHLLEERAETMHVRFVHALIRETLYEGSTASQRRRWHQCVAEALVARSSPDPDAVAYHFRQAGDDRAATWLMRAGERAERAFAWWTAVERFESALTMLNAKGASAGVRAWLAVRIWTLHRYSDPRHGIGDLEGAARLAAEANDPALTAYILRERGKLRIFLGQFRQGLCDVEAGQAALDALPVTVLENAGLMRLQKRGRAALAIWLAEAGRNAEAMTLAEQFADSPDVDGSLAMGIVHSAMGRPHAAREAFARAADLSHTLASPYRVGVAAAETLCGVLIPYESDHLSDRQTVAAEAETRWTQAFMMIAEGSARFARLPLLVIEGFWDDAWDLAGAVLADHRTIRAWRRFLIRDIATLMHACGEAELLWQLVREWLPSGPTTAPGDAHFVVAVTLQRLAAALSIERADLTTARAWLEAHDRWMGWSGAVLGQAEAALGWAMYYRAAGDASAAHHHGTHAFAHANEPRQPLALLATHRLLGELDTEAGCFTDAAAHLDQALTLAVACAAPYERALTLLAFAALRGAMRNIAAAHGALDEARTICTRLGAKPALARIEACAIHLVTMTVPRPIYPDGLTAREVEVLRLLARGRSNQEIAEDLSMSVRTAERHVSNIYSKIQARYRAEATTYAFHHNLT